MAGDYDVIVIGSGSALGVGDVVEHPVLVVGVEGVTATRDLGP